MPMQGGILNNMYTSINVVHIGRITGCQYIYGTYCIITVTIYKGLDAIVCIIDTLKLWGITEYNCTLPL